MVFLRRTHASSKDSNHHERHHSIKGRYYHDYAKDALNNVHISDEQILITPEELKNRFPLSSLLQEQVAASRQDIANILEGKDHRLLVVCGPCSIHDTDAALDYARRLQSISAELRDQLYIVMRVYFENQERLWAGKA